MHRTYSIASVCISVAVVLSFPSDTFGMGFGIDENIHEIQEIEDTDGTKLILCHKTTLYFFIAGVWHTDDGYVIQNPSEPDEYVPLNDSDIRELQEDGVLPDPMPQYSIPILEYVFGYSLWILIGGVFFVSASGHHFRRLYDRVFG